MRKKPDSPTKDERAGAGTGTEVGASEWKARIDRMKKYQADNSGNWRRNQRILFGNHTEGEGRNAKTTNEVAYGWGLVKALETSIYVTNPECMVEPYDGQATVNGMEMGRFLSSITNYDMDQMNLKAIGNLGLIDNFTCGYFAAIETIETEVEEVGEDEKKEPRANDQRYCATRIAPKDLLLDTQWKGLIDLSAARYIAVATYPTIAYLRAQTDIYTNLPADLDDYPECTPEKRQTGRSDAMLGGQRSTTQGEKDPAYKTICVWECHDKTKQKVVYVTDHKMQEIGEIDWKVKYRIGARSLFPVTLMAFHPMADGYPIPELDLVYNQLVKLNKLDAEIYSTVFSHWNKHVTVAGLLSNDEQAKLTDQTIQHAVLQIDQDAILGMVPPGSQAQPVDVNRVLAPIPNPAVPQDTLAVRDMCLKEINDILGYGPPERGGIAKTRTARETMAVVERLDERIAKRQDAIEDFYREFGAKHMMALQQTMAVQRYAKVFPNAASLGPIYMQYAKEDIEDALFNFIVFAGSSSPRNTEAKRASEVQLFQTLLPAAQAGQIPWVPLVLRLAQAFQWKGVEDLVRNPDPALKQLGAVLMAFQNPKIAQQLFPKTGGQVPPNALPEAAAQAIAASVPPEKLKMWANEFQGESATGGAPPKKNPGQRGQSDTNKAQFGAM